MSNALRFLDLILFLLKIAFDCLCSSIVCCKCFLCPKRVPKVSKNYKLTTKNQNTSFCEKQAQLASAPFHRYKVSKGTGNIKFDYTEKGGSLSNNYEINCGPRIINEKATKKLIDYDKNLSNKNNSIIRKPKSSQASPPPSKQNKPEVSGPTLKSFNANETPKITEKKLSEPETIKFTTLNNPKVYGPKFKSFNAKETPKITEKKLSEPETMKSTTLNNPKNSGPTFKSFNAKETTKITEKKLSEPETIKSNSNEASKIVEDYKSPPLIVKQETKKVLFPKIQYFALFLNHTGYKNSTFSDDSYDLLKPKCSKCQQQDKKILGFLCNHNLCEDCTSLHCAYIIFNFFNQYKLNPNQSFQFCYSCPIYECGLKISFPTALLLKRVRGWLKDPWFRQNYSCFEFFEESSMDLWVPYFDGIFS